MTDYATLPPDTALAMDITELADLVSSAPFWYRLTEDEAEALPEFGGRYYIIDCLLDAIKNDPIDIADVWLLIEPCAVSAALTNDGLDRVPMLSENTALARIVWTIGPLS